MAMISTMHPVREAFTLLKSIRYQLESRDGSVEVYHDVEPGSAVCCTDTEGTDLSNKEHYTVGKLWGNVRTGKHAFIEIIDRHGTIMGEYGLWRFLPVDPAMQQAALEYEEILEVQDSFELSVKSNE